MRTRPGQAGPGQAGPGQAGPGHAGPGQAGPGQAGPDRQGQQRRGQNAGDPGAGRAAPALPAAGPGWLTWRRAMQSALYGPGGFYARGEPAAGHFRTSVGVPAAFAAAVLALLAEVDAALGHPPRLDLVDVGAGRGELLAAVLGRAAPVTPGLARRIVATAVEVAPRPAGLDARIRWRAAAPARITGLVIANEWLDAVPLDVVVATADGPRLVLVDPRTGRERPGPRPAGADLSWLRTWWPLRERGERAEIGHPRCRAWAGLVSRTAHGLVVAADYGHLRAARPRLGTLTGYLGGRHVPAVPDGSRDITAHVAFDACADAGLAAGAGATLLTSQRDALRALGVSGRRPPLALAGADPAGYAGALARAGDEAELIDPGGLGGFGWLAQAVGTGLPPSLAALGG